MNMLKTCWVFFDNHYTGATNLYEIPHGESETDDQDDYENAEPYFFYQDISDNSNNDYTDVGADEQSDVDGDYENVEVYANFVQEF